MHVFNQRSLNTVLRLIMIKNMFKSIRNLLIICFVMASCSRTNMNKQIQNNKQLEENDNQIITPNEIFNSKLTPITLEGNVINNTDCWKVKQFDSEKKLSSYLLLRVGPNKLYMLWNLDNNTFTKIDIPIENLDLSIPIEISLDGKQIAGILDSSNQLFIYSGGKTNIYNLPDRSYSGIQFLLNNQLLISVDKYELLKKGNYSEGIGFTDEFYLLDITSGKLSEQSQFLPGFILMPHEQTSIQYSSDLQYISYIASSTNSKNEIWGIYLPDEELIKINGFNDTNLSIAPDMAPGWIPGTNKLSVILWVNGDSKKANFYSLSLEGEINQITEFSESEISSPGQGFMVFPKWSADGRFILYNKKSNIDTEYYPYVWDSLKQEAFRLCFPDDDLSPIYSFTWTYSPIYLLANTTIVQYEGGEAESTVFSYEIRTFIIDVEHEILYEIPKDDILERNSEIENIGEISVLGLVDLDIQ